MKYIIFLLFPIFCYSQQDSTVFQKRTKGWYKITIQGDSLNKTTTEVFYTDQDSVMNGVLYNQVLDKARQYNEWKKIKEQEEKNYLADIRNAEKQYRDLFGKKPDLDSIGNAKQLIGTWLLNDKEITITKQLKLELQSINFVSESVFYVTLNGKREYFFKRERNWVSDNYKLVPANKKTIK